MKKLPTKTLTLEPVPSSPSVTSVTSCDAPSLTTGSDAAAARQLAKLFADAQTGMRRIVALGLFAWEIKETKLKHGEWGPWLAAHCPKLTTEDSVTGKAKPSRALTGYMDLTRNVLEHAGFTVEAYLAHISNSQTMRICHGGKYLLLPDKKLPEDARSLKTNICSLVDGKTQRQLFLEFKQVELDQAGRPTVKVGRLKGQGGRKPLSLAEQSDLLVLQAQTDWIDIGQWLDTYETKFTALPDLDVTAQIATLERALSLRKAWLKQPLNARDPEALLSPPNSKCSMLNAQCPMPSAPNNKSQILNSQFSMPSVGTLNPPVRLAPQPSTLNPACS